MTTEQQRLQTKRALSLDDLVNHDEIDGKKRSLAPKNEQVDEFNDSDDSNSSRLAPLMDDETDTDDEVGGNGGVNFNTEMTFDYDKQDRDSAEKTNESVVARKKDTEASAEAKSSLKTQKDSLTEPKHAESSVNTIFDEKASLQSKKNNLRKDLRILNEIAATSKPNKYKNVPIWAQKWKPTIKALQNIDKKDFKIDNSFLNIIPDDDLTKSVQDWVYATIYSISPDLRPLIEMEMKFGVIMDRKTPDRINPPVSSQAVYTELDAHMTPNIEQPVFDELKKYLRGISEVNENSGKFSIIESQTKDSLYRVGVATQRPRFLRMSTDMNTGRVAQFIEKRKIAHLLLFSPKDSYDVKLSINLEIPVPDTEPPEKYKDQTPMSERLKQRISFIHNDSCTRIDVTKVSNQSNGRNSAPEITHEIELEINTPALLSAFDDIATDSKVYASVIRTFLNNGTLIRRKLSSLSYDLFEGQKKGM
ncbi:hypothetical protein HG537_0C03990 [Torulaspora globosa]|uniref:mRNA-capping enzyme subunit beta n=1 Tax=Torulaspora globosa TaxID=48254 RepID=A0A7H9HQW9_9SACH|nr:hypothetical protein HG537_0C03990 [Torulaspora sp. CBS 2947]